MSGATPNRKPATPATGRRTPNAANTISATTPTRDATRSSTSTASGTAANGINRTKSVRNGAPISARERVAARKTQTPDSAAEEEAKAEQQARMDELQQKLNEAERAYEESKKQAAVLQARLDDAVKEQGMLEERFAEQSERINDLENEKKESLRARREMEQIYESEKAATTKEKEEALAREEEMQNAMQRLKESLAQREMRAGLEDDRRPMLSRPSSGRSTNPSPNPDGTDRQFAPPSVQRSDSTSRNNSKLVMQKDKIIEGLRMELAEAQIKLVEVDHLGGGRVQEIQKQLYDAKMQNARLMEENESFQLLLSEKTLNGDFLRAASHATSYEGSRPPSRNPPATGESLGGTSLADELESQADSDDGTDHSRRLQAEVNGLRDQNKALTLYINNIISRLLQHEQFEQILDKTPDLMSGPGAVSRRYGEADKNKDLPAPPPDEGEQQPSLLQRAKSVMGGNRPKTRPLSQQVQPDQIEAPQKIAGLNEDPQTAPSVPISRSRSTRGANGHRRANSEWPAGASASVVPNMYRGPSQGPLSPGLTSPTGRNSFFGSPLRSPSSGSHVPTIAEIAPFEKENAQRDSKFTSQSNRNSVISNPGAAVLDDDLASGINSERSNPSSPPRSTTSLGEKDKQSGAIMMGSKPRPLRLVQENVDEDAARKQANRSSWFGWMNKGGAAPGQLAPGPSGGPAAIGDKLSSMFGQRKAENGESGAPQ
ncbi:uncharacterized protein MYCFIDRAFT_155032 [Pseudocercospora fijiensis CIRAD86]|uniref:Uncharacterized protein n=1 Tax=Pseudocercospora fijiensis (strain CIRAD86) TaxID=383855 RepID=M2ZNR0_PSEFD|nr:uncharacterized protein MYCFIDRAFT_155032 [Pseudocercospora fijiensis CIRAD86]EME80729.1 hypothetical protein MYCFIDRAFT_155032 [Pseudocercospora fijiensis CIRAD86]